MPAPGAHAHLEPPVALLLQDRGDVHVARRAEHVDHVVGLPRRDAGVGEIGLREVGPDHARLGHLGHPSERRPEQAEEARVVVLVHRADESCVVEVLLAQPRGDPERLRGGRLVLEPTGVRDQARVETDGDVAIEVAAHRLDQAEDHLARGRRVGIHEADAADPVVRAMVIDPDQLAGPEAAWPRTPNRSNEAQSHVTITAGASGNLAGGTR